MNSIEPLLLERAVPVPVAVVDDGHQGLAGHVAPQDENVGLVMRSRVQELAPARLGPVDVRGEEDTHVSGLSSGLRTEVKRGETPIFPAADRGQTPNGGRCVSVALPFGV